MCRILIFLLFCSPLVAQADSTPYYSNIISSVSLDFNSDGHADRAVLVNENGEQHGGYADLYIYLAKNGEMQLQQIKKNFSYLMVGPGGQPNLSASADLKKLIIHSQHMGIGWQHWYKNLEVVYSDGNFYISKLTYEMWHITGEITYNRFVRLPGDDEKCEIDYEKAEGVSNGRTFCFSKKIISLNDWPSEEIAKLPPRECGFIN